MTLSRTRITESIRSIGINTVDSHSDGQSWLSSVLTNHVTCQDGLDQHHNSPAKYELELHLRTLVSQSRASLAILNSISPLEPRFMDRISQLKFPAWISVEYRKLMDWSRMRVDEIMVVAKDGSGKYKTVKEAVAAAPANTQTRCVIFIKKGMCKENLQIPSGKNNVMLFGNGMDAAVITGSLTSSTAPQLSTLQQSLLLEMGSWLKTWFQNTAGAAKHQAVALLFGADKAIIYRCKIDACQDTLYTQANTQFCRDSYITGAVDFIFGNAAVVFQNCKIVARKPGSGKNNMLTARGRTDTNQVTGTSIQVCQLTASADLEQAKCQLKTYLGRPWKEYSRNVVMQSTIGYHFNPAGWAAWSGDLALKTSYYGVYLNKGAGSGTAKRVSWSWYHAITNAADTKPFPVSELIQGATWLKSSGVALESRLCLVFVKINN